MLADGSHEPSVHRGEPKATLRPGDTGQSLQLPHFIPTSPSGSCRAVRALCDHSAAGPDQLSFQRGDVLRVLATVDEDWLRCGRDGAEGLVPVGYTSLVL